MTPLAEDIVDLSNLSYPEVVALTSGLCVNTSGDVFLDGVYVGTVDPVELTSFTGSVEQSSGSYVLVDGKCFHVSAQGIVEKGIGDFHKSYCGIKGGGVSSTSTVNGEPNIMVVPPPVVNQDYNQGDKVNYNTQQNENITPGEFATFTFLSEVAMWAGIIIFIGVLINIGSKIARDNPTK